MISLRELRSLNRRRRGKVSKYPSSQKLWRVVKEPSGYYYEIKLAGMVIDRIKVEYPALATLKKEEVI